MSISWQSACRGLLELVLVKTVALCRIQDDCWDRIKTSVSPHRTKTMNWKSLYSIKYNCGGFGSITTSNIHFFYWCSCKNVNTLIMIINALQPNYISLAFTVAETNQLTVFILQITDARRNICSTHLSIHIQVLLPHLTVCPLESRFVLAVLSDSRET